MMQFSVIIPTRNRPQALAHSLQSFMQLDYPAGDWELIVVNDGGADSFTAVSPETIAQLPVKFIEKPQAGPAAARNAGFRAALFPYLAFTDDDCRVTPDWLRQFAQGFATTGCDALGGQTLNPQPDQTGMQAAQFVIDFLYHHMRDRQGNALLLVSNNAAYRRVVFEASGGFDERFRLAAAEDLEFSHRLVRRGYRQQYYPPAQIWHHHQLSSWGHVRQQFRYGRGGYYFYKHERLANHEVLSGTAVAFYRALSRHLRQSSLPWRVRGVVAGAQIAYRLGVFYERFINWRHGRLTMYPHLQSSKYGGRNES